MNGNAGLIDPWLIYRGLPQFLHFGSFHILDYFSGVASLWDGDTPLIHWPGFTRERDAVSVRFVSRFELKLKLNYVCFNLS